ncbi:MAG TPA: hypothetical protein VNM91_08085 [Dehalococcoidia bacterium]|nr:hypothetical protein [Dehalococcoidia bacterium]
MNTTQKTYTYAAPSSFRASGNVLASPPALPSIAAGERFLTAADVCQLIDAAGPLTVGDLAQGLGAGARDTQVLVEWLERNGELRRDEWDRFRLSGMCKRRYAG